MTTRPDKSIPIWLIGTMVVAGLVVFVSTTNLVAWLPQAVAMTEEEKRLRNELEQLEAQIAYQEQVLGQQRQQTASLERDVAILTAEIERAKLNIQAKNIAIQQLGGEINERTSTIEELAEDIDKRQDHLAHLLRRTNDRDSYSLVVALLSNDSLSDFFVDLENFNSVNRSIQEIVEGIRSDREKTKDQREILSDQQDEEMNARRIIEQEKQSIEANEAEKRRLLAMSQQQEASYEHELRQREQKAAEIRSRLFALRDTADIQFGEALRYARTAERATGIRPAFLLGVFQQESGLRDGRFGVNVGTCNRPGDSRGWQDIMPGPNDNSWRDDQTVYLQLMQELGRDPDIQPLSCPWDVGWGGAMGPAQFIPTTWASYKDRIARAAGVSVADPWNPQHAFIAASLYLTDLGAVHGNYAAERRAALRYYSGSNWDQPHNAFYGDGVMQNAANIQRDIDILDQAGN